MPHPRFVVEEEGRLYSKGTGQGLHQCDVKAVSY